MTRIHELLVILVSFVVLLPTDNTNYTKLFCFIRYIRWLPFIVDSYHLMTRITQISFSCHLMNLMAGAMYYLVNLVNLVIIFQTFFVPFVLSVGKIIICYWINFCPLSPKPMNTYNSLIIIDIRCNIPIKSPKIHWKSLLLYIFSANFLSYPFSKLPDPNDVVSSINAYGVNSWHLVSYDWWKRATDECKNAIKCLISAIYYIFFVLCARIGI